MKIFLLIAALLTTAANAQSDDYWENQYLLRDNPTYANPVSDFTCADPGVLRESNGEGYVACTGGSFRNGRFRLYTSSDMVKWQPAKRPTLLRPKFREPWAAEGREWAPAIAHIGDRYVSYYTQNDKKKNGAIGVAFSRDIGDGYFGSNWKNPLLKTNATGGFIDPSYFQDKGTGKSYLLYKLNANAVSGGRSAIYLRELTANGTSFASKRATALKVGGTTLSKLVESPEIIKAKGYYYLFYSEGAWNNGYHVKVARSKSILGPYEGERPAGTDPLALAKSGNHKFINVGGGSIFNVGNRYYYVYHAMKGNRDGSLVNDSTKRYLMVDEIHFRNEGHGDGPWPEVYNGTPSQTQQFIPGSNLTRFASVDVSWPQAALDNPSYSFDLIDERNTKLNACLNSSIVKKQREVEFNGNCKSLDKKFILVNGFKFRVCAAQNNIWKGPNRKVQCTPYTTLKFDSALRLGKFS